MRRLYITALLLLATTMAAQAQNLTKATIAAVDTIVRKHGITYRKVLDEYVENVWNKDKKNAELAVGIAKAYYNYYKEKPEHTWWSFYSADSVNAYKYINRAIEADPKYAPAYIRAGDMQKVMNDTLKALDWYNRGIKAAPASPDCYIAYARCLLEQRDTVNSINKLREINGTVPDFPANLAMARICKDVYKVWNDTGKEFDGGFNRWANFQRNLYAMTDMQQLDSADIYEYAFNLFTDGDYEKAYELAKTGLERYPNNVNVLKVALYSSTQSKKYDDAIMYADRLFGITDTIKYHTLDYENAATAYRGKNNLVKAAEMYHKAYDLWEENLRNQVAGTKFGMGDKYMQTIIEMYSSVGLYDEAIEENLKWIEKGKQADKITVFHYNTLAKLYSDYALESFGDDRTTLFQKSDEAFGKVAEVSEENKMYAYYQRWKIAVSELDSVMGTNYAYDYAMELVRTYESLDDIGQIDGANRSIYLQSCRYLMSYHRETGLQNGMYCYSAVEKMKMYVRKMLEVTPDDEALIKYLKTLNSVKANRRC